jgi:DNA invertase Pin-like site-specific DNA recombinase
MGGQTLNTSSAMGRFFLNTMAGFAELERNLIAERTSMGMSHKKKHKEVYSPTPFGFERSKDDKLIENSHELKIVDTIRKWHKQGWSLRRIAEQLTKLGVETKQGGKWYASTVKYLLENNLYQMA